MPCISHWTALILMMSPIWQSGRGQAREIIYAAPLPDVLEQQILVAYCQLQSDYGDDLSLAVRSSATAEDLPTASFAGQQDTFLKHPGRASLIGSLQTLLCQPVHRPCHPLPHRPGL